MHLELAADDAQRRGHTPEDAVRAARIRAGGVSQAMDALRDQRGLPSIDALVRDLRFGVRMLTKDRWITLAAVVALAIGIAANTTVFTIVNAILLRDLPFDQPDRIVAIGTRVGNVRTLTAGVSYADFQDWRAAIQTFEGLGAMRETTMNVGDERVRAGTIHRLVYLGQCIWACSGNDRYSAVISSRTTTVVARSPW